MYVERDREVLATELDRLPDVRVEIVRVDAAVAGEVVTGSKEVGMNEARDRVGMKDEESGPRPPSRATNSLL